MSPGRSTLLKHNLRQTAVYWANPQNDGFGGKTFDDPIEISVRWEDRQELFIDANGQEKTSQAVVYLAQDIDLGGYLYLGTLVGLSSAEEGDPLASGVASYEIRGFRKVPDIRGERFSRKVWL